MALTEGQVQVRDLVMGPGTPFDVTEFNPFRRRARSASRAPRPWGHGSSSGAQWGASEAVRMRIVPHAPSIGGWLALEQQLAAAFRPAGDDTEEVECRFALGGREYVMFGQADLIEEDLSWLATGNSEARGEFFPSDPRIYDATRFSETIGLPTFEGGLTVPFTVPFTVDAVPVDGQADLTNEGTTDTGLTLRIDGPVSEPRVTVQGPDGSVSTFRYLDDVPSGRFLLVAGKDVLVDGLSHANRRGQATWTDSDGLRLPGEPDGSGATSTILFRASNNEAAGTLTASARSAWW